ncbi:Rha family transcriptional regulator [Arthrobacter sp. PAMC 25486]|uniref:Rha family transcriptional regulator n=1 Tax=Arthrobacter sp. PAMC 25486 TaxID=1494608 RepID=UPI000689231C|nr:Rha family transcriptional regulator [Arthrobacter sp. PAMC 25486]
MTTAIVPTIENHTNGLIVTSETIAQGAGVEHRAVLQLVDKYRDEIDTLGQTAFEMRSGEIRNQGGTGRPVRTALLNEPQSSLLMMFMRNTAQVVAFKLALVTAFYQMRNLIESPIVQEALFGMDHDGFMLG